MTIDGDSLVVYNAPIALRKLGIPAVQIFDTYPDPPDDPTRAALSYPPGGGTVYTWDVTNQVWV